jgi:hypothetical protein
MAEPTRPDSRRAGPRLAAATPRAALAPTPRLPLLRLELCNSGAGCGPKFLAGVHPFARKTVISVICPPDTIKNGGFLRFLR